MRPLVAAVLGTVVASVALILGSRVGGPLVRQVFGIPSDFQADYTSLQAGGQAVGTLFVVLLGAFGAAGASLARLQDPVTKRDAWWAANPLSMAASYFVHYGLSEGAFGWSQLPYEFYGPMVLVLLVVGSWAYVRALLLGARLGQRLLLRDERA